MENQSPKVLHSLVFADTENSSCIFFQAKFHVKCIYFARRRETNNKVFGPYKSSNRTRISRLNSRVLSWFSSKP